MADSTEVLGTTPKVLSGGPQKYVACTIEYYESLVSSHEVNPRVMYLVNTGIEDGVGYYTELYYGYNRLTDLIIKKGELNSEEILNIPNNKLVLNIVESEDTSGNGNGTKYYKTFALKLKYNDQLIGVSDFAFQSLEVLGNNILKIELKGVDGAVPQPIYIPLINELPEGIGNKFLSDDGTYKEVTSGSTYTGTGYITVDNTNHTISTTLHAGSNVTIGPDGAINASGGGGGTTYTFNSPLNESSGTVSVDINALISALMQTGIYTGVSPINIDNTTKKISITIDGQVASGNTGILTGGTVYNYLNSSSFIIDDGRVVD